ncbi:MAG: MmgE/PrpD family protein [Thermorudis peleae]|nr:MmgE/PrpD family protein [Thermorudis peleae]
MDTHGIGLTAAIATWVAELRLDAIPEQVQELGIRHLLDTVGVTLAGATEPLSLILQADAQLQGGAAQASVLGTRLRLPLALAARLNGAAAHALDYDDTQLAERPDRVSGLLMHPSAPVYPAALAMAEHTGASGEAFLTAYLAGVEVACKLAEAANPRLYAAGFHTTGVVGCLGAAVAAAKLLWAAPDVIARALSLAAAMAGGLREQFGTMTKPWHAGRAAENGVTAALLAARGYTAAPNILEAERGFFHAYADGYDPAAVHERLGNPWTFERPGIALKPAPSGSLTHPALDAMLDLVHKYDLRPEQVVRIDVGVSRYMTSALLHPRPQTALEAKFSLPYAIAIALLDRASGLAQYSEERVHQPDIAAVLERITVAIDPAVEASGFHQMTTRVRVTLHDGRTLETTASSARGHPQRPFSREMLLTKFRDCAGRVLPAEQIDRLIAAIEAIRTAPTVRHLVTEATPEERPIT